MRLYLSLCLCNTIFTTEKLLVTGISISIIIQTPALIRRLWLHGMEHEIAKQMTMTTMQKKNEREKFQEQDDCLVYLFNPRSENWRCAKRNVGNRENSSEKRKFIFGIVWCICIWLDSQQSKKKSAEYLSWIFCAPEMLSYKNGNVCMWYLCTWTFSLVCAMFAMRCKQNAQYLTEPTVKS